MENTFVLPHTFVTSADVHFDPDNLPLYRSAFQAKALASLNPKRILYLGCGTGIMGFFAHHLYPRAHMTFTDISRSAIEVTKANCINIGVKNAEFIVCDMFESIPESNRYDMILFQPPQTGGNQHLQEKRPDKFGGSDGLKYVTILLNACENRLNQNGSVLLSLIDLANIDRFQDLCKRKGLKVDVLTEQTRIATKAEYDLLAEGSFEYIIDMAYKGKAKLCRKGDKCFEYQQKFYLLT